MTMTQSVEVAKLAQIEALLAEGPVPLKKQFLQFVLGSFPVGMVVGFMFSWSHTHGLAMLPLLPGAIIASTSLTAAVLFLMLSVDNWSERRSARKLQVAYDRYLVLHRNEGSDCG